MQLHTAPAEHAAPRHRPKTLTVFAAAFAAGAVLAYGVNRVVDVHVVQVEPQVESEPIFVALRTLPQGAPVTVYDVALRDWPKAMLPTTALGADACLEGFVLRHEVREGQPLLSVQLVRDATLMPTATVAMLPTSAQPVTGAPGADAAGPRPVTAVSPPGTTTERFVPAAPAEPPAAAATIVSPEPVAVASAAPTASGAADDVPTPATRTAPSSTDIDADIDTANPATIEPALVAVVGDADVILESAAETPAIEAEAADVVAVVEPVREPAVIPLPPPTAGEPTPVATEAARQDVVSAADATPLAPPVPALPSTDIERSLARFGRPPAEPAPSTASVLDRSTEAEPPAPQRGTPRMHLVVPERIALAVDASFTQQPQPAAGQATPAATAPDREPSRDTVPGGAATARGGSRNPAAATSSQRQAGSVTRPNSGRPQPAQRSQPSSRPEPTTRPEQPRRGLSAWLPQFPGTSRQQ